MKYHLGFTVYRIFDTTRHSVPYTMAQWTLPSRYNVTNAALYNINITKVYRSNTEFFMLVKQTLLYLIFNNTYQ